MKNEKKFGNYFTLKNWRKKLPSLTKEELFKSQIEISNDLRNRKNKIKFKETNSGEPPAEINKGEIEIIMLLEDHLRAIGQEIEKRRE